MNKLLILCGLAVVSTTFTPVEVKYPTVCEIHPLKTDFQKADPMAQATNEQVIRVAPEWNDSFIPTEMADLDLKNIPFIEEDDVVDLGFDAALYLPEGFDPHKTFFDMDAVIYIEDNQEVEPDFDTAAYLPEAFNAYAPPSYFMSIAYIEAEAEEDLGFDTSRYLPADFNPYDVYVDLNSIVYIEEEEEIVLGFNTTDYLPRGFDPYSR